MEFNVLEICAGKPSRDFSFVVYGFPTPHHLGRGVGKIRRLLRINLPKLDQ
jgi:hypothetical protein